MLCSHTKKWWLEWKRTASSVFWLELIMAFVLCTEWSCNNDFNKDYIICYFLVCISFPVQIINFSHNLKHLISGLVFPLTSPKILDPFTVRGTLLGWADTSVESASGLIVTLGLPVTAVNTARTMTILIIVCRKTQMLEKRKAETTSVKECMQGNDPPASVELYNRGGGGGEGKQREEAVQILLSSWHDLFIIFSL